MITLLGFGLSTQGVAKFEIDHGRAFYWVTNVDERDQLLAAYPTALWREEIPKETTAVVISPGIPPHDARLRDCVAPIYTDVDWYFYQKKPDHVMTIGVTGTNGKSSFVAKLAHALSVAGMRAKAAGNIGISPFEINDADIMVFELSSFQLHYTSYAMFDIGVIGSIRPDHLSWHGDFESYKKAKERLSFFCRHLMRGDLNDQLVCQLTEAHFGVLADLSKYAPLPFRLQLSYQDADWLVINDSKATNIDACLYALSRYSHVKRLYLICGGILKESISDEWIMMLRQPHVYPVFQGQSSQVMYDAVKKGVIVKDYRQAILYCQHHGGGVILFSPAGSSFDQFKNYMHRGQVFEQEVMHGFASIA